MIFLYSHGTVGHWWKVLHDTQGECVTLDGASKYISNSKPLNARHSFIHEQQLNESIQTDSGLQVTNRSLQPEFHKDTSPHVSESLLRHSQGCQRMFGDREPWKVNACEQNLEPCIMRTFAGEIDLWVRKFCQNSICQSRWFYVTAAELHAQCTPEVPPLLLVLHPLYFFCKPLQLQGSPHHFQQRTPNSLSHIHTHQAFTTRKWVNLPLATAIMIT